MTPIVLHHGFLHVRLGPFQLPSFKKIDKALAKSGRLVLCTAVHPTASIEHRARELKTFIQNHDDKLRSGRIIIVAHSMGGLDARYAISKLGLGSRVKALITVATPHYGSPLANWAIRGADRVGANRFFNLIGLNVQAVHDLTTEAMRKFNSQVPDSRQVQYFSVSGSRPFHQIQPLLMPSHKMIAETEGDNDGVVSVISSTWGKHQTPWPADHLHLINRRFTPEVQNPTGDVSPYYERLLETLKLDS